MGRMARPTAANPITVKAKPGYAVAGVNIRTELYINGISVNFMKLGTTAFSRKKITPAPGSATQEAHPAPSRCGLFLRRICGHLNNTGPPCSLGFDRRAAAQGIDSPITHEKKQVSSPQENAMKVHCSPPSCWLPRLCSYHGSPPRATTSKNRPCEIKQLKGS